MKYFEKWSQKELIGQHEWPITTTPLVSICCFSYNHESFIRDSIDGFLRQRTTFPVEIIIHDDASIDGTMGIIREYEAKCPHLYRNIIQRENQWSKGQCVGQIAFSRARGSFIAICEGDDFWTCSDKLQDQIELINRHPEASGCIHRADGRFEEIDKSINGHFGPEIVKTKYTVDDLLCAGNFVPSASCVFRREVLQDLPTGPHVDFLMLVKAALSGPLLYIDKSMSVYRKHAGGIHSGQPTAVQILRSIETLGIIASEFGLADRPAFKAGLKLRLQQMEREIQRYERTANEREIQHRDDLAAMKRIQSSKTFKIGRALNRLKKRVRSISAS